MKIAMRLLDAVHFRCLNARGTLFTVQKALPLFNVFVDIMNRLVWHRCRWVRAWGSRPSRWPAPVLACHILPDVRHFAISNGNGENPIVLERPIRAFDSPRSEADDQNPVSLRYEFGGSGYEVSTVSLAF
jgi:hypothetical protein